MNRGEEAKDAFREARGPWEAALRTNRQDQLARLNLASIHMNLDDFQGAVNLLREGQQLHPDGPFSQAIAQAFVIRFDKLQRDGGANPALQLELLRIALQHDPNSREVLTRMISLGESSEEDLKATRQVLETLLASGYTNAFAHFVLGCKSWEAGESETAIFHFERAYQLDDSLGPVANNLAWILSHDDAEQVDEPQLKRALQLIDSVIERWPNNPTYRDTRGQVLVKLGRWKAALDDLEFALPTMSDNAELHLALAVTYDNLGRKTLAAKHQELAMQLTIDQ
jgi:tetratricopeptide (TPR) repeat protein